jgi:hypothetical protein
MAAHWRVKWLDGREMCFNSVRTMVAFLKRGGVEITTFNMFNMDKTVASGGTVPDARLARFRSNGIESIEKLRGHTFIIGPPTPQD